MGTDRRGMHRRRQRRVHPSIGCTAARRSPGVRPVERLLRVARGAGICAKDAESFTAFQETFCASSPSPLLSYLGSTLHGTVGYFSSDWPLAYLVATAILGIALLIGSLVPVSEPAQVARQSSVPGRVDAEPKTELVGRITGMVDCQFIKGSGFRVQGSGLPSPAGSGAGGEGSSDGLHPSSPVSLGDKFALASGLMEITYDSGAKVILQGPASYQVESANGGFLPVGKLLGKVTTEKAKGFRIRTPTAEVVDLGTEFGIDVAKDGTSEVHVLKGLVQTQFRNSLGQVSQPVRLREGEGRRYQYLSDRDRTAQFGPGYRHPYRPDEVRPDAH